MPDSAKRSRRWEIADYAQAFESCLITPLQVAESILEAIQDSHQALGDLFIAQDPEHLLQQARLSTSR